MSYKLSKREITLLFILGTVLVAGGSWFWGSSQGYFKYQSREDREFYKAYDLSIGNASPEDLKKAVIIYEKLAIKGHVKSQNNLAALYQDGQAVTQDIDHAIVLYKQAYDGGQGNLSAHIAKNLGNIFYTSEYDRQNIEKAIMWYEKAAEKDNAYSEMMLGYIYLKGEGEEPPNIDRAKKWMKKAARHNNAGAAYSLSAVYLQYADGKLAYISAGKYMAQAASMGYSDSEKWITFYKDFCYAEDPDSESYPVKCWFNDGVAEFRKNNREH